MQQHCCFGKKGFYTQGTKKTKQSKNPGFSPLCYSRFAITLHGSLIASDISQSQSDISETEKEISEHVVNQHSSGLSNNFTQLDHPLRLTMRPVPTNVEAGRAELAVAAAQ